MVICDGDGCRHSRCRLSVLQKPILGTADSKYWHCLGARGVLPAISEAIALLVLCFHIQFNSDFSKDFVISFQSKVLLQRRTGKFGQ